MVQNYDATAQSIASPGATLGTDWSSGLILPGCGPSAREKSATR
jgi:hypothetical protein